MIKDKDIWKKIGNIDYRREPDAIVCTQCRLFLDEFLDNHMNGKYDNKEMVYTFCLKNFLDDEDNLRTCVNDYFDSVVLWLEDYGNKTREMKDKNEMD